MKVFFHFHAQVISFFLSTLFSFIILPCSLDLYLQFFPPNMQNANKVSDWRLIFQRWGMVQTLSSGLCSYFFPHSAPPLPSSGPSAGDLLGARPQNVSSGRASKLISSGTLRNTSLTFAVPVSPNKEIFTCICLFNTSDPQPILEIISDLWLSLRRVSPCLSIMPQSKC